MLPVIVKMRDIDLNIDINNLNTYIHICKPSKKVSYL